MEKKQSSIEWFYQRILAKDINEVFEQAKAMHRKEIEEAYVYGVAFQIDIKNGLSPIFYYKERFGDEKEVL